MSGTFYKILHLSSLFGGFFVLGGLWLFYAYAAAGGGGGSFNKIGKKALLNLHGLFFCLIFVSGFALIAKLKIPSPWPFWLYIKLTVYLLLGASPYLLRKTISQKKKTSTAAMISLLALLFWPWLVSPPPPQF